MQHTSRLTHVTITTTAVTIPNNSNTIVNDIGLHLRPDSSFSHVQCTVIVRTKAKTQDERYYDGDVRVNVLDVPMDIWTCIADHLLSEDSESLYQSDTKQGIKTILSLSLSCKLFYGKRRMLNRLLWDRLMWRETCTTKIGDVCVGSFDKKTLFTMLGRPRKTTFRKGFWICGRCLTLRAPADWKMKRTAWHNYFKRQPLQKINFPQCTGCKSIMIKMGNND